jgi:hypothetical protein
LCGELGLSHLATTERLIAKDSQNTRYRRDLSINFGKVGSARSLMGDLDGALEAHRSGLAIGEYLTGLDPSNSEWQRDLSIGHNQIGDILLARGEVAAAAPEYRAGFVAAERLLDADPGNVQRILDVAYSRYKLATAGIDSRPNLVAARDAMAALKAEGRLPPAFESWVTMVEKPLKALPGL